MSAAAARPKSGSDPEQGLASDGAEPAAKGPEPTGVNGTGDLATRSTVLATCSGMRNMRWKTIHREHPPVETPLSGS